MTLGLIILGFVLMGICGGFETLFLRAFYNKTFTKALIFKCLASLCFLILGAITCFTSEFSLINPLIFIGLCCGIIGDVVIALCQIFPEHDIRAFIGGGTCFIVGHVFYLFSLLLLGDISWTSLIISFALLAALTVMYEKRKKFLACEIKNSLILYLTVVVLMGAVAIGVFVKRVTLGTALFSLGGILFTVSDNILFAYKLGEKPRFAQNIALHVAYYLAQFAIAWSVAWI